MAIIRTNVCCRTQHSARRDINGPSASGIAYPGKEAVNQ